MDARASSPGGGCGIRVLCLVGLKVSCVDPMGLTTRVCWIWVGKFRGVGVLPYTDLVSIDSHFMGISEMDLRLPLVYVCT